LQVAQDQHGDQRRPYLRLDRILRRPQERFDLQVLLDRLEERLDPPALLVDRGHGRGVELHVVGQEREEPALRRDPRPDDAELGLPPGLAGLVPVEGDLPVPQGALVAFGDRPRFGKRLRYG
jgi:hypothetical protein